MTYAIRNAALVLAVMAAPAVAVAQDDTPAQDIRTVHVSYADLNVRDMKGWKTLQHRINKALHRVCYTYSPDSLERAAMERQCIREARARVNVQLADRGLGTPGQAVQLAAAGNQPATRTR